MHFGISLTSVLPRVHKTNCLRLCLEESEFANKLEFGWVVQGRLAEASRRNRGSTKACTRWQANAALSLRQTVRFAKKILLGPVTQLMRYWHHAFWEVENAFGFVRPLNLMASRDGQWNCKMHFRGLENCMLLCGAS